MVLLKFFTAFFANCYFYINSLEKSCLFRSEKKKSVSNAPIKMLEERNDNFMAAVMNSCIGAARDGTDIIVSVQRK